MFTQLFHSACLPHHRGTVPFWRGRWASEWFSVRLEYRQHYISLHWFHTFTPTTRKGMTEPAIPNYSRFTQNRVLTTACECRRAVRFEQMFIEYMSFSSLHSSQHNNWQSNVTYRWGSREYVCRMLDFVCSQSCRTYSSSPRMFCSCICDRSCS